MIRLLTFWLDRRIDARIEAREARVAEEAARREARRVLQLNRYVVRLRGSPDDAFRDGAA